MGEEHTPKEFYKYVNDPVSRDQLNLWIKANNISIEKTELFFDYVDALHYIVHNTYLGEDIINNDRIKKEHFDWCWNKVVKDFELENIYFNLDGTHKDYFWNYLSESFYASSKKRDLAHVSSFFILLFKLYILKSQSELDMFYDIYNILNDNLTVNK